MITDPPVGVGRPALASDRPASGRTGLDAFAPDAWKTFTRRIKAGDLDLP